MALSVVVFDVGETLVAEATTYERWEADGVTPPPAFEESDLHPDALPCLAALRDRGLRLGAAGNMRAVHEEFLRRHVDFVGSSERWGVEKPAAGFFERVDRDRPCGRLDFGVRAAADADRAEPSRERRDDVVVHPVPDVEDVPRGSAGLLDHALEES